MRIISGKWKGKQLESPEGKDIRPTSARTREALFNILIHLENNPLDGQPVMDICCGSGALGFEALSRGAAHCHFVDNHQDALKLVRRQAESLAALRLCSLHACNATQLPPAPSPVALAMMDPPYQHRGIVATIAEQLFAKGWVKRGSLISIEMAHKTSLPEIDGTAQLRQRRYGHSEIVLLEVV